MCEMDGMSLVVTMEDLVEVVEFNYAISFLKHMKKLMKETLKVIESGDYSRKAKLNVIIENNRELCCYLQNLLSGTEKVEETLWHYKTDAMLEDWKSKPLTAYIK